MSFNVPPIEYSADDLVRIIESRLEKKKVFLVDLISPTNIKCRIDGNQNFKLISGAKVWESVLRFFQHFEAFIFFFKSCIKRAAKKKGQRRGNNFSLWPGFA